MPSAEQYREERSFELQTLLRAVLRTGIATSIGTLGTAIADCRVEKPRGDPNDWGYQFDGLAFNVTSPSVVPKDVVALQVSVGVDLAARCNVLDDEQDILKKLVVDIVLGGYYEGEAVTFAWHLDRNIVEPGDGEQEEMHPLYHLQHGGNKISPEAYLGETFFTDPPRLIQPPLDAILAVDFVLSNFSAHSWKTLRDDDDYLELLRRAQARYWKPYFACLGSYWSPSQRDQSALLLCPTLVPADDCPKKPAIKRGRIAPARSRKK